MPVACFSEEGPLSRSSLNGGRRRVSAWANPILSVQVCSLKKIGARKPARNCRFSSFLSHVFEENNTKFEISQF